MKNRAIKSHGSYVTFEPKEFYKELKKLKKNDKRVESFTLPGDLKRIRCKKCCLCGGCGR